MEYNLYSNITYLNLTGATENIGENLYLLKNGVNVKHGRP